MAGYERGGPRPKRPRMDDGGRGGYSQNRMQGPSSGYGADRGQPRMPGGMPPRILHINIENPKYPITVEVLHTIASSSGNVERIAISKKNGVQAMIEFSDAESAKRAKEALDGADIYSGCCTLHIEFSTKQPPLNIYKNDSETWDYTNPNLGEQKKALLASPEMGGGYGDEGYQDNHGYDDSFNQGYGGGGFRGRGTPRGRGRYGEFDSPQGPRGGMRGAPRGAARGAPRGAPRGRGSFRGRGGGPPPAPQEYYEETYEDFGGYEEGGGSPVLMLYGLNFEKMTCQKVFNLFCLYGNVHGVKFLKTKEGVAMVQMGDPMMARRAMQNLSGTYVYGKRMIVDISTSDWLQEVHNPFEMKCDNSPSYMNFGDNRHNRFRDPNTAARNRIQPPFKTVHFFNVPPDVTDEQVCKIFEDAGAKRPNKVKIFRVRDKANTATGLAEFESIADTVEAIIHAQHSTVENPGGKYPYTFKVCFSSAPITDAHE